MHPDFQIHCNAPVPALSLSCKKTSKKTQVPNFILIFFLVVTGSWHLLWEIQRIRNCLTAFERNGFLITDEKYNTWSFALVSRPAHSVFYKSCTYLFCLFVCFFLLKKIMKTIIITKPVFWAKINCIKLSTVPMIWIATAFLPLMTWGESMDVAEIREWKTTDSSTWGKNDVLPTWVGSNKKSSDFLFPPWGNEWKRKQQKYRQA